MGPLNFALHLTGFAAPAIFLALLLPLASRLLLRRQSGAGLGWQFIAVLVVGLAVLAGGLWWFGRDGKMLTYAALVLAAASAQWLTSRSWR